MTDTPYWGPEQAARLGLRAVAAEEERDRLRAECERLLALANTLAALGDRLLLCAELELMPGADLAREWAAAREGVGGG
jgi:hypothetical protein